MDCLEMVLEELIGYLEDNQFIFLVFYILG